MVDLAVLVCVLRETTEKGHQRFEELEIRSVKRGI